MTLQLHFKGNTVILVMLIPRQIYIIARNLFLFIININIIIIIIIIISLFISLRVSKVVLQKRKSARDNAERCHG